MAVPTGPVPSNSDVLARYPGKPADDLGRFGNSHLRWTVLYAALVVAMSALPLWLSLVVPAYVAWVNAGVAFSFGLCWLTIAVNALRSLGRTMTQPVAPVEAVALVRGRVFRHIVVVPCYTDPVEVLFDCLGSLLAQRSPSKLVVVVAFEARTPNLRRKVDAVLRAFDGRFGDLAVSVHGLVPTKEIPGGCSNKNFALRQAYHHVKTRHADYQDTSYTVTTCDTDSLFSPQYFEVLEACYNRENPHPITAQRPCRMNVWQPPLFYNWDLDTRPFFVRITGVTRAMMMLGGLISFDLNPMSIFSYPLELGFKAGFINPRYSVDDIIFKVRCMCLTNERIPVLLMPAPVISGPTIGTTYCQEVREWARQIRRWIIGSSESFHYCIIHWKGRPFAAGLGWFLLFFVYYAVLLCAAGVFSVAVAVPLPWVTYPAWTVQGHAVSLKYVGLVPLALQYVAFAVAFHIDARACRILTVQERIGPLRRLAHLALAPFVLLAYSFIAFYAVVRFVFVGKRDAGHVMAAKAGLGAAAGANGGGFQSVDVDHLHLAEDRCAEQRIGIEGRDEDDEGEDEEEEEAAASPCDPSRSRSTSFSRQASQQLSPQASPSLSQSRVASPAMDPELAVRATSRGSSSVREALPGQQQEDVQLHVQEPVLCELPEWFFFGETAFDPRSVPQVPGRQARIYGLEGMAE